MDLTEPVDLQRRCNNFRSSSSCRQHAMGRHLGNEKARRTTSLLTVSHLFFAPYHLYHNASANTTFTETWSTTASLRFFKNFSVQTSCLLISAMNYIFLAGLTNKTNATYMRSSFCFFCCAQTNHTHCGPSESQRDPMANVFSNGTQDCHHL